MRELFFFFLIWDVIAKKNQKMNTQKRSQTKKTKENQSKKYERIMRCFKKTNPKKRKPKKTNKKNQKKTKNKKTKPNFLYNPSSLVF